MPSLIQFSYALWGGGRRWRRLVDEFHGRERNHHLESSTFSIVISIRSSIQIKFFNSRELICFLPDENKLRSASLCQLSNLCLATRTTTSFIQRYTVYNDLRSYHRINSSGFQLENVSFSYDACPSKLAPLKWR